MDEVITELHGPELAPKSGKVKKLVILLHGFGSDGKDLIGLAPEFITDLPDTHFISPNAPFSCDMSPFGYQWFGLMDWSDRAMYQGAQDVAPILNHFIDQQLEKFNLEDKDLAIIGFSQGTMMALHIGLRRKNPCAAIVGYSGKILNYKPLSDEAISKPNIALVHGMMDPVVPFIALKQATDELAKIDITPKTLEIPMLAHGMNFEAIEFGKNFIKDAFC